MPDTHVRSTDVKVPTGKKKKVKLNVNGVDITIHVPEALFAHYQNQFVRQYPTEKQRNMFATLMSLMRAAYLKGCEDAGKNEPSATSTSRER